MTTSQSQGSICAGSYTWYGRLPDHRPKCDNGHRSKIMRYRIRSETWICDRCHNVMTNAENLQRPINVEQGYRFLAGSAQEFAYEAVYRHNRQESHRRVYNDLTWPTTYRTPPTGIIGNTKTFWDHNPTEPWRRSSPQPRSNSRPKPAYQRTGLPSWRYQQNTCVPPGLQTNSQVHRRSTSIIATYRRQINHQSARVATPQAHKGSTAL